MVSNFRDRRDRIAWQTIRKRRVPQVFSGHPNDYQELSDLCRSIDFMDAVTALLDRFYSYKRRSFFEREPPNGFDDQQRAFLAGVAEFMCRKFDVLPIPEWTEKPEYFLREEYDWTDRLTQMPDAVILLLPKLVPGRRERSTPEFRRRNILFEARNLIIV